MSTANDPRSERVDQPDDASIEDDADLLTLAVQHPAAGICVLTVDGELDALSVPLFEASVREQIAAMPAHLILDLQAVRFLASSGLNFLLTARELAQQTARVQLHLAGVITPAVLRPLEVTGLLERFDTYPTLTDALAAIIE